MTCISMRQEKEGEREKRKVSFPGMEFKKKVGAVDEGAGRVRLRAWR